MKRATGPGTIEFRPVDSKPNEELFSFSLTNFDVEDASLKDEHKKFIEEVVPQLTEFPGVFVSLQGMTSRTALTGHFYFDEAADRAAHWSKVTGRRYAVRADHTYGLRAWWAVVAA